MPAFSQQSGNRKAADYRPSIDTENRSPATENREQSVRNLLSWARALLIFWPYIFLVTVTLEPISLLAGVLDKSGRARHTVVKLWSAIILKVVTRATVSGLERIDASKPRLYVANHLSAMDIPLLYRHLPFPFRIMAHRLCFACR